MKIVLCTRGGLPGAAVLAALQDSKMEVAGVVQSTRTDAWQRIRRSGLPYAIYLGCLALPRLPPLKLPVLRTRDVNARETRDFIDGLAPQLVVSAFFNQKIGPLPVPAINIHPSLLPQLKGVDPVFHARLRGAPLGVSVHRVTDQLDSGDLIAQQAVSIPEEESVLAATVWLYSLGAQLLAKSIDRRQSATPQAGAGSYDSWPQRAQVAELRAKGVRLVRLKDLLAPAR